MNKTTLNEQAQAAYSQFMFLFTWIICSILYCICVKGKIREIGKTQLYKKKLGPYKTRPDAA